jgi:hypothetical protein
MIENRTIETPLQGKTFSLYGDTSDTTNYYSRIRVVADLCLGKCPDIRQLIFEVQKAGKKRRFLKRQLRKTGDLSLIPFIVQTSRDLLAEFTTAVRSHLQDLSIFKRWDSVLITTEEQYHLFMLEIELVNRAHAEKFKQVRRKIAFLPYCLHDLDQSCRSAPRDIDHACKGCSNKCFINQASTVLKKHGVEPYIWMNVNLKTLLRDLRGKEGGLGVLGIACIPELARGMRSCIRLDVPVVGIPLDANRCMRWMGEFRPTSVNLEELENLIR